MNSHASEQVRAPDPPLNDGAAQVFHVGTLTYTRAALINVFFWMLWGDVCLNLMESVIPRLVPLQLAALGASNAVIGILTGSIFSLMNWFMNPIISTWSDRHRSRLGRRMPFMLYPTPFLAFFLILVGFSSNIAGYIHATWPRAAAVMAHGLAAIVPSLRSAPPLAQLAIGVIAVTLVLFKFFDLFPQCVYYYLFADVIPQRVMGTFVCLFRLCATLGIIVFHYWILPHAQTHPRATYASCGLLYLVAFVLLSLIVKEGKYPPPPPRQHDVARSVLVWLRESFSTGFYWKYYLTYACFRWAYVPFNTFLILYAQEKLHMSPGDFGHLLAIILAVQLPVLLLLGPVLDRLHPVRVGAIGYALMWGAGAASFFLIRGKMTFLVLNLCVFVAIAVCLGSISTLGPRLLPRPRYGQFCAATAMVSESGLLLLSWVCGVFLDAFGEAYIYVWFAFFAFLGMCLIFILFRAWRKLGGDKDYCAPTPFECPCGPAPITSTAELIR